MPPSYSIEHAKSGRSKCKKCKEPIAKNELRIGTETETEDLDYSTTAWHHPKCFFLPRKLREEGYTAESFVTELLTDNTGPKGTQGNIASDPDKLAELVAEIDYTATRASSAKKTKRENDDNDTAEGPADQGTIAHLKEMRHIMAGDDEPDAKKLKLSKEEMAQVDVYVMYEKYSNGALSDILGWNRQLKSGNKDMLMARVIDGQLHGRLGRCPMCIRGKMQLQDSTAKMAICKGHYDQDLGGRVSCSYKCPIAKAPREHPWFTEKPSEEEDAAMDAASEALKKGGKSTGDNDALMAELEDKADALEWNLETKDGMKQATADIIAICNEANVDIPETNTKMEVGKIVASNQTFPASEVIKVIVEQFGFAKANVQVEERKDAAIASICHHPANMEIVKNFLELSDYYNKDHNFNTANTYKKVATAVAELDFEITEDNAKGLGKGKTKIDNIGKGSADKIYEFLTTGKIQKLEEKRATHG